MHVQSTHNRRAISLLFFILTLIFTIFPLLAADTTRIYDQAGLFSSDQVTTLESIISELKETYSTDLAIVTINDAKGKSSMTYADDFYDENGFGIGTEYDGVLLLIDMDNREIYISTSGKMIQYYTDQRISNTLDHIYNYVSMQDYYHGAKAFLSDTQKYLDKGISTNQYSVEGDFVYSPAPVNHEPFTDKYGDRLKPENIALSTAICIIFSLIVAFIVRGIIISVYKHPRHTIPSTVPNRLSVHYSERDDHFVTSHTSRIRIQSNASSGGHSSGRSSTHHSSSGRSHGGGGRKF